MKKRHLFYVMLPLAAFVLGACSDELEGSQKSQWTENGTGIPLMDSALTLTQPHVEELVIYLHAEESNFFFTRA